MTLGELINLVCVKCHRTDDQTKAEVREYISARYKMLWDSRPWRDSLGLISIAAADVSRITILPGIVDRVQGVRWGDSTVLLPVDLGVTFVVDPTGFDRTGQPASFTLISPTATEKLPGGGTLNLMSTDVNANYAVSLRGMLGNIEQSEMLQIAGTGIIPSTNSYDEILSISKSSTTYDLIVKDADDVQILRLEPSETSRQFQRIHFHSTPADAKALLVLFKRRFKPLILDSDSTELTGIDNALLAAAIADVLEGQRQYGKAQLKMQESGTMAQGMADLERHQSASGAQLIPWDAAMSQDDEWRCW